MRRTQIKPQIHFLFYVRPLTTVIIYNNSYFIVSCYCIGETISLSFSAKNFFRVMFHSEGQLQTHSFQASDAFNKQQWLNCIRQAKEAVGFDSGLICETQFPSGPVEGVGRSIQCSDCSDCNMMDTVETGLDLDTECPKIWSSRVSTSPL